MTIYKSKLSFTIVSIVAFITLTLNTSAQICSKYEITPDTVIINTPTSFAVQEVGGGINPPALWNCNWIDFENDGTPECNLINYCDFTFTAPGLQAVSFEINEPFPGITEVCTVYVYVKGCNTGIVTAIANGVSDSVVNCFGDDAALSLMAPDADLCTGNWEYLWYDGLHYYDGVGFNSATELWSTAYQNVIAHAINHTSTFMGKIRCSALFTCTDSALVKVLVKPGIFDISGSNTYCDGFTGIDLTLSGSETGVNYQLLDNGSPIGMPIAGTGTSLVWNNLTAGIYTISASNNQLPYCTKPMNGSLSVTSIPIPTCNQINDIEVCHGELIDIGNFVGNPTGTTFTWTNTNTSIGLFSSGTGHIPAYFAHSNCTGVYIIGTITVTPDYNGCTGPAMSFNITIKSCVEVFQMPDIYVCPGETINIGNFVSMPSGGTFDWTNSNVTIGLSPSGTGNIPSWTAPANNTCFNITSTITVISTLNGCVGLPMSFTVTIYPTPQISQIADLSACPGQQINAGNLNVCPPGCSFQCISSNPALFECLPVWTAPANNTGSNIVGSITFIASLNGCMSTPMSYTVTIYPEPVVFNLSGGGAYCEGTNAPPITLSGSETAMVYQLYNNSGLPHGAAVSGTGNHLTWSNISSGTYTVKAFVSPSYDCETAMNGTVVITENPLPIVNAGNDQIILQGATASLTATVSGGSGNFTYQWVPSALVNNPNSLSTTTTNLLTPTTFIFYVTDNTHNCTQSDTIFINFSMMPLAVSSGATPNTLCAGDTVFLSAQATGGSGNYTYTWTSIPAGFTAVVQDTFALPQTHTEYIVTVDDGYSTSSHSVSVAVYPLPTVFTLSGNTAYCTGTTGVSLILSGSELGVNYQLLESGNTVGMPVQGTGNALVWNNIYAGTYVVNATSTTTPFCSSNMNGNLSVTEYTPPVVDAGYDTLIPYCTSVQLNAIVTGGSGAFSFYWTPSIFVTDSLAQNPSTIALTNPVQLIVYITDSATLCTHSDTLNIYVAVNQLVPTATALPLVVCAGDSVQLDVHIFNGIASSYTWSSVPQGFNASSQNPIDTPLVSTTYTVVVYDGCQDVTASVSVTVASPPNVYNLNSNGFYCEGAAGTIATLDGSDIGITYQLFKDSIAYGLPQYGIGSTMLWDTLYEGNYYVCAYDSLLPLCNTYYTNSISIVSSLLPIVDLGNDTTLCDNQHITLTGPQGSGYGYMWLLLPNDTLSSNQTLFLDSTVVGAGTSSIVLYVSNSDGCSSHDTILVIFDDCTNIDIKSKHYIEIFPNPARTHLSIKTNLNEAVSIEIITTQGKIVLTATETDNIDISSLPKGMYYIRILMGKELLFTRFVKI